MSRRLVLIDSSAWISYLAGAPRAPSRTIETLLLNHQAAVNSIIRIELLTGARDEAQYAELEDDLRGLRVLALPDAVWRRAERMRFQLKQVGRLIPIPDVIIACCALVHGCELLHLDRHFDLIARTAPLKIYHLTR